MFVLPPCERIATRKVYDRDCYFKRVDSVLTTTASSHLTVVPYSTIAAANEAVNNVIDYSDTGKEETSY